MPLKVWPGDVLLISQMPFKWAARAIEMVQGGKPIHHCATVLPYGSTLMVYEAQPPVSRKLTVAQYDAQLREWSKQEPTWRKREDRWLSVDIWRPRSQPSNLKLLPACLLAEKLLGTRYSMVFRFLFAGQVDTEPDSIHCSMECRMLEEAWGGATFPKKPVGRTTPLDVAMANQKAGWSIAETVQYR